MYLTRTIDKLPLARIFALVALLCVGALQVQEAGHQHWGEQDGSYAQCLVCKSSSGAILPAEVPRGLSMGQASVVPAIISGAPRIGSRLCFEARGPPFYS